ncbi:MAG: dipicolinate synthase subunit DpsA [Ruminococcaceae bacterium]|nr:dipicolinate synthase subunit DpsA [Oscillospiraceae bacterium]
MYKSVAVIGGDKRQLYCADAFLSDGLKVTLGGFEKLKSTGDIEITSPLEAALCSEFVVLPLPCVKGDKINAPFSNDDIMFTDALLTAFSGKKIFCGQKDKLLALSPKMNPDLIYDYSDREEFAVYNAVATAEGALEIAMREYEGTISRCKCLVCGYGRIGKVLTNMLCALNAKVTVSARKKSDLAWISTKQCEYVQTKDLDSLKPFDIIFNTVPALVFDSKLLSHIAKNAILIDLASVPGGVDFESASRLSICAIHALSLPGKAAPKTAGEIIKNTITNMLEEDDRCQKNA